MSSSVVSGLTTAAGNNNVGGLDIDPAVELIFNLSTTETNPKVTMTLKHPGGHQEYFAFKVKTTQPRRYLVRPNQGLIGPNGSEQVQILLVEKDKKALLQSYQRLGQTALDHAKDKFLVQSCQIHDSFVHEYNNAGEGAYDTLSNMWATVTNPAAANNNKTSNTELPNSTPVANKKLHVRHTVSDNTEASPRPTPPSSTQPLENMTPDQLTAELTHLRRKYDELVAFSVNLTAERDILNNTLEQTKRDLNREMNKKTTPRASATSSSSGRSSSRWSSLWSLLTLLLGLGLGIHLQARDKVKFVHTLPVVGEYLTPQYHSKTAQLTHAAADLTTRATHIVTDTFTSADHTAADRRDEL